MEESACQAMSCACPWPIEKNVNQEPQRGADGVAAQNLAAGMQGRACVAPLVQPAGLPNPLAVRELSKPEASVVILRWLLAIPLAMMLAGCVTSPTGRTQLMLLPPDLAMEESRTAYVQTLRELTASGELLNSPVLVARIRRIAEKLVGAAVQQWPHTADWVWSVALIDDPETVNAWCMAGGRMAVYSGLIGKLNLNDDELAHVMGHEMAHALANHSAERMSMALLQGLAVLAAAYQTEDQSRVDQVDRLATVALRLPNSRAAEYEADQLGMELAVSAGFRPHAAVSLWNKMDALEGSPGLLEFLSTHPSPANRAARLQTLADRMRGRLPGSSVSRHAVLIYP